MLALAILGGPMGLGAVPVAAAGIAPGGALDLTITGFLHFEAFGGQLDDARQDPSSGRGLDFRNDTEVHVLARARSAELGLDYGATIEFAADTDEVANTKETWLFVRGGWGELRLGDVEGVAEESSVGAQDLAAGTGGIDGDVVDEIAVPIVYLTNTDTATKLRYYSPSFAGLSVGVSYTPTQEVIDAPELNGQFQAHKRGDVAMQAQNVLEAGLIYAGEGEDVDVLASLVGLSGQLRNEAEAELGRGRWQGWQAGASVDLLGLQLAGSLADEQVGDLGRTFLTAGVGWGDDEWHASLTYGRVLHADHSPFRNASNLVLSADYTLLPGLVLAGDVGWFDNNGTDPDYRGGDRGWQAVAQLGLAF